MAHGLPLFDEKQVGRFGDFEFDVGGLVLLAFLAQAVAVELTVEPVTQGQVLLIGGGDHCGIRGGK